jgi:3',5'-cyclic AMP phosphodiesterase CpdA
MRLKQRTERGRRHLFLRCLLICLVWAAVWSCASIPFRYLSPGEAAAPPERSAPFPQTDFMVFSDPHFYLAQKGAPPVSANRGGLGKMAADSAEIGRAAADLIRERKPAFVLVPGDLTENGSLAEHRFCAALLGRIEQGGTRVFVIPGNHDIRKSAGGAATPGDPEDYVTTPERFADLYKEFGYGDALYRDEHSLSYVAEPVPGLWLLALDATVYTNEDGAGTDRGYIYDRFPPATLFWIEDMLAGAAARGKAVIVMQHYAVLEHFRLQKQAFPGYVLDHYAEVAAMYAHYRLHVVFSGHFHSQDITLRRYPQKGFLYDIETGSLVTYPCALREVQVTDQGRMRITTDYITATRSHPRDFREYARRFFLESLRAYFASLLTRYDFSKEEQELLIPQLSAALLAHSMGDEHPPEVPLDLKGISFWHKNMIGFRRKQFESVWNDLAPPDNNVVIDLESGDWSAPATP